MKFFVIWQSIGIFISIIVIFYTSFHSYKDECIERFLIQYQYPFFYYKDISKYMDRHYPHIYGKYFTSNLRQVLFFYCLFGRLKYIKKDGGFNDLFEIKY